MKKASVELLAHECSDWRQRGLIDAGLYDRLGERYDRRGLALSGLVTWLGLAAMLLLGMAILTAIGMMWGQPVIGGLLLGVAAAALWRQGIRMAADLAQRHPVTGSALVTIALAAAYGTMVLLASAASPDFSGHRLYLLLIITGALAAFTAYAYHLRWPLLLSLLCLFHGMGAWQAYAGSGAYVADIQDPPTMAIIAALCVAFGLWHQQREEQAFARYAGFGRLYVIFGLLYLNGSLWFLTLGINGDQRALAWVLCFSAACVAQIVLGARLKDGKLTGFGIVFLGIDLYTRFFEYFWDRLSLGLSLLLAGLAAMLLGWWFERRAGAVAR